MVRPEALKASEEPKLKPWRGLETFVGRTKELFVLDGLFDLLKREEPIGDKKPFREFWSSIPGMGKTSLLEEAGMLAKEKDLSVVHIDCSDETGKQSLVKQIGRRQEEPSVLILDNFEEVLDDKDFLSNLTSEELQAILDDYDFASNLTSEELQAILDDYDSPLDLFEPEILRLLKEGKTAVVVSSQDKTKWKELGMRQMVCSQELGPLNKNETGDLYDLSFGVPGLIEKLTGISGDKERSACVAKFIDGVFVGVPGEYQHTVPLMELVGVLRRLDVISLRYFADAFLSEEYGGEGIRFYRNVLGDMLKTGLVRSPKDLEGYHFHPVLRKIISVNMARRNRQGFLELHNKAVELYDNWIKEYPGNKAVFLIERTFHQASILKVEGENMQPAVEKFEELLGEVEENPKIGCDFPDIVKKLIDRLEKDTELGELLGEEEKQGLLDFLKEKG